MAQALADQPTAILSTQSSHAVDPPMDSPLKQESDTNTNRRRSQRRMKPVIEQVDSTHTSHVADENAVIHPTDLPTPPSTTSSTPRQRRYSAAAKLSSELSKTISNSNILSKTSSEMLGNALNTLSQDVKPVDSLSHQQDHTQESLPPSCLLSPDDPLMTGCIDPNSTKKRAHSMSALSSSSMVDTPSPIKEDLAILLDPPVKKKKAGGSSRQHDRQCTHCGTYETPMWRRGPLGTGTLCNKCGVKWRNGRLPASAVKEMLMQAPPRLPPPPPSTRSSVVGRPIKSSYETMRDSPLSTKDIMKASVKVSKSSSRKKRKSGNLTYSEKQKLTSIINDLPIEQLGGIVEIIRRASAAEPEAANQDGELEVDLDAVPNHVLLELTRYVERILGTRRILHSSSSEHDSDEDTDEDDVSEDQVASESEPSTDTSDDDYM